MNKLYERHIEKTLVGDFCSAFGRSKAGEDIIKEKRIGEIPSFSLDDIAKIL